MRLVDTTEVSGHTQRQIHAAWAELHGQRLLVPPAVALEVAPGGSFRPGVESEAEQELRHGTVAASRQKEVAIYAWWTRQWRNPKGAYGVVVPTPEQEQLASDIQHAIEKRCFPNTPSHKFEQATGDPRIVAETLAVGGTMLLTSDRKTIDRRRVNEWAVANGDRMGFAGRKVVFLADLALLVETREPKERERWLQAGLIAAWPAADNPSVDDVANATKRAIASMTHGTGGKLKRSGQQLLDTLAEHPSLKGLVERTRARFPSATIDAERQHPTYSR